MGKTFSLTIRGLALFILLSSPVQCIGSFVSDKWRTSDGLEIPYNEFPAFTIALMVTLGLLRAVLMFSALWSVHNSYFHIARYGFFTRYMSERLGQVAFKLLVVGLIDLFGFSLAYLSLALLDDRLAFDPGISIFLTLLIAPDKLLLAGLAFAGAKVVRKGIELDNELKLTV